MKYTTRDLTTMEMIQVTIADFKDNPDARLDTIYVNRSQIHDILIAHKTYTNKEYPHEFVKFSDTSFTYYNVDLKYDEKVEL